MTRTLLLLVDDAPDVVLIVRRLARLAGQEVIGFADVPSAWEYLTTCVAERNSARGRSRRPDLALVDVNLPGPSGLELCRRVRSSPELANLPLALFGSEERTSDIAAGLQAGADFLLSKELLSQPRAWQERLREILSAANSQAEPASLSCQQGPSPQPAEELLEAIHRALQHPAVRRLGREVLRVIVQRAEQRTPLPHSVETTADSGDWRLTEELKLERPGLTPIPPPDALHAFALALGEQLERLLGKAAGEPFRAALEDVPARPDVAEPMRPVHAILLVEDNPADVKITQRALQESGSSVELIVVRDGQEALDYLLRQGEFAGNCGWRRPDLILLDLNLPRVTGLQVVERIRATPELKAAPVVVLTTSCRPEDVHNLYAAGANSYVAKPQDFNRFVEVLRIIQNYWLQTALLPPPDK